VDTPGALEPLSHGDLEAVAATPLPAKEVMSLLDLNVDIDLALDLVAPIDLAVAGNLNVAAPINAGVAANLLAVNGDAGAQADQVGSLDQILNGDAIATAPQNSLVDQTNDDIIEPPPPPVVETPTADDLLSGPLLNVDVNVDLDANLAAPIAGAVALNANVAAPINAGAAANIGVIDSDATAIANQDIVLTQHLDDVVADATADQTSEIQQ
jgi:hypothetical protein